MPDRILSKEEIDALLSAINQGQVDLAGEKPRTASVTPYDLTSQNKVVPDKYDALEGVYDRFTTLVRRSLTSPLRSPVDINLVSVEMIKFGELVKLFSNPTSFNIITVEPLHGSALIAIEPNLAFSLIDWMLGGKGTQIGLLREFTLIEQRVLKKLVNEILKELEKSWEHIFPLRFTLKKTETKPQFVRFLGANEQTLTATFSLQGEEFTGNIFLSIPYLLLEPIKDKLANKGTVELDLKTMWNSSLQHLLKETHVNVSVQLGTATNTILDILNLREGDVIQLDNGPEDPITITVENVPKYKGIPGVFKGNRAVQVQALFQPNGGLNGHGHKQ